MPSGGLTESGGTWLTRLLLSHPEWGDFHGLWSKSLEMLVHRKMEEVEEEQIAMCTPLPGPEEDESLRPWRTSRADFVHSVPSFPCRRFLVTLTENLLVLLFFMQFSL